MNKEDIKIIGRNEFMGNYVLKKIKGQDGKLVDGMEAFELIKGEEAAMRFSLISFNIRHLMGEVLTMLEATIDNDRQLKAAKSIIKKDFGAKISWIYEQCGCPEEEEDCLLDPEE